MSTSMPVAYTPVPLQLPVADESQPTLSISTSYVDVDHQPIARRLPVRACRTHQVVVPSPLPPSREYMAAPSRKQRSSSNRRSKSPPLIQYASPIAARKTWKKAKGSVKDDEWVPTSAPRTRRAAQGGDPLELPQPDNPSGKKKFFKCRWRCGESFERWTDEVRHIETAACDFIPKSQSQTATVCTHCKAVLSRSDACLRHQRDSCRMNPKSKRYLRSKARR